MHVKRGAAGLAATAITMFLFTAPSASALTTVTENGVAAGGGFLIATPTCPGNMKVISGGFGMPAGNPATGHTASVNRAKGRQTWVVKAQTSDPLKGFAYCSRNLNVAVVSKTVALPEDGTEGAAKARCNRGQTAVSGGWKYSNGQQNSPVFKSSGAGGRRWSVKGFADEESPTNLTAYAYCLRGGDVTARSDRSGNVGNREDGTVQATCRPSEQLLGGGFATSPRSDFSNDDGPDFFYHRSARQGTNRRSRGWRASAHNYGTVAGRIKTTVLCLG